MIEDLKSGNAQDAVSAMNRLITINNVRLVMTSFTASTQAIAPLADQHHILLVNGGGVSNNRYLFIKDYFEPSAALPRSSNSAIRYTHS